MILTKNEIIKQVKKGHITIEPFDASLTNPNSYNYRLGPKLIEITNAALDPRHTRQDGLKIEIPAEGFVLEPGKLYLGSTYEKIGSSMYVTSLIGRSSVGRLGLFVQITADLANLGANHHWTLELTVVQPLRVYPGMKLGQVSFWEVEGSKRHLYQGKYHHQTGPLQSRLHTEIIHDAAESEVLA